MAKLVGDCLLIIFTELQHEPASLYSCILVNRFWCRIAVPILWNKLFKYKNISYDKLYKVIINLLPTPSKQLLINNNIELPLFTFSNKSLLFNYINFLF